MKPKSQPETYWIECGPGRLTGIDWSKWLGGDGTPIDPYLVWADISGKYTGERLSFIIEMNKDNLPYRQRTGESCSVPWIIGMIDIPAVYRVPPVKDVDPPDIKEKIDGRFITAQLYPCDVIHLLHSPDVKRAQLGIPRLFTPRADPREPSGRPAEGEIGRVVVGIIDDGFGFAHERLRNDLGWPRVQYLWDQDERREEDLRQGSAWRKVDDLGYGAELVPSSLAKLVAAGQDDQWAPYATARYGRFRLDPDAHSTEPVDAAGRALPVPSMLTATHGHAILDLATGYPPIHLGQGAPLPSLFLGAPRDFECAREVVQDWLDSKACDEERRTGVDSADQWHLVLVQLPVRTVADTTGGSLAVHMLDGIRYILDRAKRVPAANSRTSDGKPNGLLNPVVVNISYGAIGGGHDGTSIAEAAIKELTEKEPTLWIVLAAGNAHRSRTHASALLRKGSVVSLFWTIGPDNPLESFLEIWLPDKDAQAARITTAYIGEVEVQVKAPDGRSLQRACVGQAQEMPQQIGDSPDSPAAALIFSRRVVQSEHGTMVLLAVAPTRGPDGFASPVPHGEWILTLSWGSEGESASSMLVPIHAWSERGDLLFGVGRPQQSHVVTGDEPGGDVSEFDPEVQAELRGPKRGPFNLQPPYGLRGSSSFSSLASIDMAREKFARPNDQNHGAAVVAGGYRLSDGEVSRDSSGGPGRLMSLGTQWQWIQSPEAADLGARRRPDANAPSDLSPSVPGLRISGLHSAHWVRASGSSVAAAYITRAIANVQFLQAIRYVDSSDDMIERVKKIEALMFQGPAPLADRPMDSARATLTPRLDDAFRAAPKRVR